MRYIKVEIETASAEQGDLLIAVLSENKYYAFEQENNLLHAYVIEEDYDEEKLKELIASKAGFRKIIIEEENWNKQWESSIEPVIVHDFAAIRPSFHEAVTGVEHDLVITPKMSFGTGHHATTFLMIRMMSKVDFKDKKVLDFGTGTAVLAILAEKCGASKVIAVDHDSWSIDNALENIKANGCSKITVRQQNDLSGIESMDIVLANINLHVLKTEALPISLLLKPGSLFLASGFLLHDENEMETAFKEKGLVKKETLHQQGWLSVLFEKR